MAKEVEDQESEWEIRRKKMSEGLGKLSQLVEDCDKEFERLDQKAAEGFKKGTDKTQDQENKPGNQDGGGSGGSGGGGGSDSGGGFTGGGGGFSGGDISGGGSGVNVPHLGSDSDTSVSPLGDVTGGSGSPLAPDTEGSGDASSPTDANPEIPPLEGTDSGTNASDGLQGFISPGAAGSIGTDPERNRQLGQLINDFAQRWAELTGQPVGTVLSVMGGLLGAGALASLGVAAGAKGTGPMPGQLGSSGRIGSGISLDDRGNTGTFPDLGSGDSGTAANSGTSTPSPELPSLAATESAATTSSMTTSTLPSLDSKPENRSTMAGAPMMMGGMGSMGSGGSGGGSSSSDVSVAAQEAAGFDRRTERQEAANVLLDDDQFRGEGSDGSGL